MNDYEQDAVRASMLEQLAEILREAEHGLAVARNPDNSNDQVADECVALIDSVFELELTLDKEEGEDEDD